MNLCALLLSVGGATLVYLASVRQHLLAKPLHASMRGVAAILLALGLAAWITTAGMGAGSVTALTCWMLSWVALPYLAWWHGSKVQPR